MGAVWGSIVSWFKNEQVLIELVPGLWLGNTLRDPAMIRDAGIQVMIDLSGRPDRLTGLSDSLEEHHWYAGVEDAPVLPPIALLDRIVSLGEQALLRGAVLMVH
jgi:hypothetical protein